MPNDNQWRNSKARQAMYAALRRFFAEKRYEEVETPILVPTPGMEPHIEPFEVPFVPQTDIGRAETWFLHTSPEYAMKRLLADGCGPIFQICKVFRNGEIAAAHNPEFTLLEFYRPHADYHAIMEDLEEALSEVESAVSTQPPFFSKTPYERLTVHEAVLRYSGIDIRQFPTVSGFASACEKSGVRLGSYDFWDDVFFHLFLQKVEPQLGLERPTFLMEYPASMAALARLKPEDSTVAERVELYAKGRELANGFSELTDAKEQRARLEDERRLRMDSNRPGFALDERFLSALEKMPPSGGIAVGLDRILMLMLGTEHISDVMLFPAREYFE